MEEISLFRFVWQAPFGKKGRISAMAASNIYFQSMARPATAATAAIAKLLALIIPAADSALAAEGLGASLRGAVDDATIPDLLFSGAKVRGVKVKLTPALPDPLAIAAVAAAVAVAMLPERTSALGKELSATSEADMSGDGHTLPSSSSMGVAEAEAEDEVSAASAEDSSTEDSAAGDSAS